MCIRDSLVSPQKMFLGEDVYNLESDTFQHCSLEQEWNILATIFEHLLEVLPFNNVINLPLCWTTNPFNIQAGSPVYIQYCALLVIKVYKAPMGYNFSWRASFAKVFWELSMQLLSCFSEQIFTLMWSHLPNSFWNSGLGPPLKKEFISSNLTMTQK